MTTLINVRSYHLDGYQHVNNARYLEFLEEARWEWLGNSEIAAWMQQHHLAFVAVNININYRRAAVAGDCLEISSRMDEILTNSAVMAQQVRRTRDNCLIADARITFVCLDLHLQKSQPVTGELRRLLQSLCESGAGGD